MRISGLNGGILSRVESKVFRSFGRFMPAKWVIDHQYLRSTGLKVEWEYPRTFNDKIQYLKLFWRDPRLTICSDKYLVRDYVKERISEDYLNELISVHETPEDIDFDKLPASFFLKLNHGSGFNIPCRDKSLLDRGGTVAKLKKWQAANYYYEGREWAYKDIRPLVLCERYIDPNEGVVPEDYKIYCFEGVPRIIGRFVDHRCDYYDLDWRLLKFRTTAPGSENASPPPRRLEEMLRVAARLAEGLVFVRVDLYAPADRVIFGEMTFYPHNGMMRFHPEQANRDLGDMLNLTSFGIQANDRLKRT